MDSCGLSTDLLVLNNNLLNNNFGKQSKFLSAVVTGAPSSQLPPTFTLKKNKQKKIKTKKRRIPLKKYTFDFVVYFLIPASEHSFFILQNSRCSCRLLYVEVKQWKEKFSLWRESLRNMY